ncbi:MAG: hypothetical protein IT358_00535 [Gemmatimonadaceae bacterium]|nr:hypothetical protein [Gemmatimonadota bacterium]MBK9410718.1 hypothetical protein [Gemmatimonadota bacterium]MCC7322286.1 hypothetical protein [Gemmatimonadaceae bacterium]
MLSTLVARRFVTPLILAATLVVGACSDDPTEPEDEPEVQTLTLTVGSSTITIDKTTGAASGNLVVPAGTSTVAAQWKRADGSLETLITSAEFDLKITPATPANLTWTPNGAFAGTLVTTGLASNATTNASVALFHKEEQHEDFGPYNFTVRVQ